MAIGGVRADGERAREGGRERMNNCSIFSQLPEWQRRGESR